MIRPAVKAVDSGTGVYDKTAGDLQSDIRIKKDRITGTLLYVKDYKAFGGEESSGNFLALALTSDPDVEITTEIVNGTKGPVKVGEEGFCVYRIKDKDHQKIKITYKKGDYTVTKVYTLTGLTLKGEE